MEKEEQLEKEQGGAMAQAQDRNSGEKQNSDWQANLRAFFDAIKREDETFADHVVEVKRFYAETAHPALDEVAGALKLYGRECETGEDAGRVYIIVRAVKDKVEFQYAVVAETKIEGITPYVHCWYEEVPKDEAQAAGNIENDDQNDNAQSQDEGGDQDDDGKEKTEGKDQGDEKKGAAENSGTENSGDENSGDDKSAAAPKRLKTVERLASWSEGRDLQSVTREEIINDFLAHYKNAVARLRAPLHHAQKDQAAN